MGLAAMAIAVLLEQATEVGAEAVLMMEPQEAQGGMVGRQAQAVAEAVRQNQALVAQAAQAAEARCEYGPGSSEHRRTQRPGCAEA